MSLPAPASARGLVHGAAGTALSERVAFALTGFGSLLVSMDVSVANSLLPAIGAGFGHPSRAALSWVITAYAIAFAAALVPAGRLADRLGRRRVFFGGLVLFCVASLLCALAPDLATLIAARIVQGIGAAVLSPASLGLLLHAVPSGRRAVYTARWSGMGAVGIAIGPLVGGAVTDALSWRWAFAFNLPLVAAVLVAGRSALPETPRQPGRRLPDPVGVLLLSGGTALLTFGISQASGWGITDARVLTSITAGLAAMAVFWRRSLAVAEPVLDLALLRSRHIAAVTGVSVAYSAAFFGLLFSFVAFLAGPWHLSLVVVGLALLPMPGTVAPLTFVVGHFAERTGFRRPIAAGAALMAVGLLLQAALDHGTRFAPSWLGYVTVVGLGIGLCFPLLGGATVAGLPPGQLAAASAVNQCARQLGAALGIATTVAVLGPAPHIADFHTAWVVGAAVCGVAAVLSSFISDRPAAAHSDPAGIVERAVTDLTYLTPTPKGGKCRCID